MNYSQGRYVRSNGLGQAVIGGGFVGSSATQQALRWFTLDCLKKGGTYNPIDKHCYVPGSTQAFRWTGRPDPNDPSKAEVVPVTLTAPWSADMGTLEATRQRQFTEAKSLKPGEFNWDVHSAEFAPSLHTQMAPDGRAGAGAGARAGGGGIGSAFKSPIVLGAAAIAALMLLK